MAQMTYIGKTLKFKEHPRLGLQEQSLMKELLQVPRAEVGNKKL